MHWIALQAQPDGHPALGARTSAADAASPGLADAASALGWWALQFTPRVARVEQAVVMEVSASERLFGGRQQLLDLIFSSERPVSQIKTARASTSLVALARLQLDAVAPRTPDQLPLATLADAQPHLALLERLGCTCWGDVRALPRGGVARRFGASLLDALDRAYGLKPEVYPWLVVPDVFDVPLELAAQVEAAPALMFAARRLLSQLQVWLRARKQGVLALELAWQMDTRRHTATRGQLVVRTAVPTLDMHHMQRLLAEHLARTTLPAPVLYVRLRSVETAVLPGANASLLPDALHAGDSLHQLLERLSARLGPLQVLRSLPCADYRPERMQTWVAASVDASTVRPSQPSKKSQARALAPARQPDAAFYPAWLLAQPLKLALQHERPLYQGPLTLLVGPQRLEAGWWDAATLRDYFIARSEEAGLVWIYRERLAPSLLATDQADSHWYLQGLFG